ncbi:FtsX-like permease family protein [Parabacteroides sp.]
MGQLYYTIRYLLRGRGGNVVKVLSLTLGLGVGLILFARVAFELSFDTFFDQVEDLYSVHVRYNDDKAGEEDESRIIFAPIPEALRQEFPEIQYATVCRRRYGAVLYHGEDRFKPRLMMADSLFFRTMGIKVLRGDDRLLGIEDQVFLSEKMAERIFGKEDPIGKQLLYGKNYPYTVAGIFRDIPENSHLRFDAVASFINMKTQFGAYAGWGADDSYLGYIRLKPGVFPEQINQKIPALLPKYIDVEKERKQGFDMELYIKPVSEIYTQSTEVKRMVVIMSILAFALLFVAAMNYILNSVSALPARARAVGVHKCNGASGKDIFNMFMFETAALFVMALVCMALLLFAFREHVAEMAAVPTLGTLLNGQTLWLPAAMIVLVFLLSAVLPARLFSAVPVTQVFRVSTSGKQGWKRFLLFVQFGGIAFVLTLLAIVLLQYDRLMHKGLGYNPENVVYAYLDQLDARKMAKLSAEFRKLPYVATTGFSSMGIMSGYGGFPILDDDKNWLFTARQVNYDTDYQSLMDICLVEGQPLKGKGDILVNETFVESRGWADGAIGKYIYDDEGNLMGRIVGVTRDFMVTAYFEAQLPVIMFGSDEMGYGNFTVRVSELTPERLREMNDRIAGLFPNEDVGFTVLRTVIEDQYEGTRHFRDGVFVASIAILLITLMGLLGYIADEMHRRSKEIAIRKVNGATATGILRLLSKDVLITAFPAVLLGVIASRVVGESWLRQFADKIPLTVFIFISTALLVLAIIWGCVILKSWNIANENPVRNIKNE